MPRLPNSVKRLQSRYGPVVVVLVAVNLALQVVFGLLGNGTALESLYTNWLALSVPNLLHGKVWTIATYGFLHDNGDIFHVLFNMLALFFLGPQFERKWGSRSFARFWIFCIIGGGLAQGLWSLISGNAGIAVGASAAVMGLVGAWSWIFPNQKLLLFFIVPVKARFIVPLAVAIDVLLAATGSDVAVAAHLGGLGTAWLILHGYLNPRLLRTRIAHLRARRAASQKARKKRKFTVIDGGKSDDDDPRWNVH